MQQQAYQPQYQQPQGIAPVYQPVQQQPMQQPTMDPQIAQAMAQQAFGGPVNVQTIPAEQPADPVGNGYMYDEEMPF
jgi:hypothetical protein